MSVHVSSTRAHRQEVKIILYRLWYHHNLLVAVPCAGAQDTGRPPIGVMIPETV